MIMARLKQETKVYHDALENIPQSLALMSDTVSLDTYRMTLQKFYGFHVPIEYKLGQYHAEWAALGLDFEARRKAAFLEQDFELLGINPAAITLCHDLPALHTFPEALGCMYVMEGATLGGQVITRHLRKHLPLNQFHYFHSYGGAVGDMWQAFGKVMKDYAATPLLEDQIIAGACETFVKLKAWLVS